MRAPVAPVSCQVPRPTVGMRAPLASTICMGSPSLFGSSAFLARPGRHNIGPQRLDLVRVEHIAPGRHLVLAARDRADEAAVLVARKLAQIERAFRILHARAMAGRAVALENLRTETHLLRRESLLADGGRA